LIHTEPNKDKLSDSDTDSGYDSSKERRRKRFGPSKSPIRDTPEAETTGKEASKEAGHSQGQPSEAKIDRSRNSNSRVKGKIVRLNSYPIPPLTSSSSSSQSFSSSSSSTPTSRQIDNPPSQSSSYPLPTSSPKP